VLHHASFICLKSDYPTCISRDIVFLETWLVYILEIQAWVGRISISIYISSPFAQWTGKKSGGNYAYRFAKSCQLVPYCAASCIPLLQASTPFGGGRCWAVAEAWRKKSLIVFPLEEKCWIKENQRNFLLVGHWIAEKLINLSSRLTAQVVSFFFHSNSCRTFC
jgi:hypothetical protein